MRERKQSEIRVEGDVAYVQLTKGQEAIIDAADVPLVSGRLWFAQWNPSIKGYYACSSRRTDDSRESSGPVYMHRMILGVTDRRIKVDHIHHNTLDNRRSEICLCENWQNNQNRKGVDVRSSTGVRGVTVHRGANDRLYYVAKVSVVNYFPYTDDGLAQATERAEFLRERLKRIDEA